MNPAWTVEWRVAFRRPRLLALNVAVPLLLVTPVALARPPAAHAAAVYSVLFALFGVFGSAIPLVRDGSAGLLTRWRLAGLPAREMLPARLAAQSALDVLQSLPAAALIVVASGRPAEVAPAVLLALPFALVVANALGAWTAALARSLAESALFSSVLSLLLLHAAGVFRTPAAESWAAAAARVSPFRILHEALLEAAGGPAAGPDGWTPALIGGLALVVSTGLSAPFLVRRLQRSQDG